MIFFSGHIANWEIAMLAGAQYGIPVAQIYSVATFYALFNLEPQGKNTVCICRGTACHTCGSRDLLDSLRLEMGLHEAPDEDTADKISITTPDRQFTLRTVGGRLNRLGVFDPWAGMARRRYSLARAAQRLAKLAGV